MPAIETVKVIRKDHPNGEVVINRCDMQPGDVEVKPETKRRGRPPKAK